METKNGKEERTDGVESRFLRVHRLPLLVLDFVPSSAGLVEGALDLNRVAVDVRHVGVVSLVGEGDGAAGHSRRKRKGISEAIKRRGSVRTNGFPSIIRSPPF